MRKILCDCETHVLEPSRLVRKFGSKIADAADGNPVLDVACGSGRNGLFLSRLACQVICVDKDLTRLRTQLRLCRASNRKTLASLRLRQLDLVERPWPFSPCTLGGIVNVHFFLPALFPFFESSMSPGGYFLFETVPGCGGNYLELPKAGELWHSLRRAFEIEFYQESKVGPRNCGAVTVQLPSVPTSLRQV